MPRYASARWVLGGASGIIVVARVTGNGVPAGLEVTFEASVGSAGAKQIAVATGDDQTGPVGSRLPDPLVVLVTDQFGNPVAGVPVAGTRVLEPSTQPPRPPVMMDEPRPYGHSAPPPELRP